MNCTKNLSPTNCDLWKDRDSHGCYFCEHNTENYKQIDTLKNQLAAAQAENAELKSVIAEYEATTVSPEQELKEESDRLDEIAAVQAEIKRLRRYLYAPHGGVCACPDCQLVRKEQS